MLASNVCQRGECLGASHLLGLEAAGAHVHLATHAVDDNVDALDVGTELTIGDAVGVADGATQQQGAYRRFRKLWTCQ